MVKFSKRRKRTEKTKRQGKSNIVPLNCFWGGEKKSGEVKFLLYVVEWNMTKRNV